jgi:predicted transcriptional regulator
METKRVTIYLDSELHRYLTRKAARSDQSISQVVKQVVRAALAEDAEDLNAFRERAGEPNLNFADVVKSLRRRGKI